MNVIQQKNILYINTNTNTYSGSSIITLSETKECKLEVFHKELEIIKVEGQVDKRWAEIKNGVIKGSTTQVRILFKQSKYNQSVTFFSSEEYREFTGVPVEKEGGTLFPVLSEGVYDIDMLYIVPNIPGITVVSSGVLTGVYDGGTTKTFHYRMDQGRPSEVLFCGGMFSEGASGKVSIMTPAPLSERFFNGRKESLEVLKSSITALQASLDYKLPFAKMYVVFCMCEVKESIGRNCAILNISQIIVPEAIDQCFSSIRILTRIITQQYFGILSYAPHELDEWMYVGLSEHLSMYLVELFLGVNEVRYELNRNIEYIHREDIEEPPLSSTSRSKSTFKEQFFIKKSEAFIRVLENNLTRAFMQKIIKEVLEIKTGTTQDLIRIVKGITGKDLRPLFDVYVYKTGIPTIYVQVEQNQRIGGFSVVLKQKYHSVHPEANKYITGNICVRICETDSVLDHVLFIGGTPTTHEISCHQRGQRRRQKGEESTSLLWIRIDPGLEWMKVSSVEQADYMFSEQLVSEKDVYGQMEALSGVQKNPSETICAVLEKIMGDPHVFYKVSIAAGVLLAKSVNEESGYFGFQRVVQFFISNYCIQNTTIVQTNDFSQFRSYFIQKNIAASMSLCQLDATKTLGGRTVRAKNVVSAFLLNLMRYNDNTGNSFEDSFYLADIITALSIALCSDAHLDAAPFVSEIERLRKKDLLFPSHQNVITCASIKALTRLAVQGHLEVSLEGVLAYAQSSNFYKVRMAAYESILLLFSDTHLDLLLDMIQKESRLIRVHILKRVRDSIKCASLPIYSTLQSKVQRVEEIRATFRTDPEIDEILEEILALLTEATEITVETHIEECAVHDLSSDEAEHHQKVPKLTIKLSKPVVLRIQLSKVPRVPNTHSTSTSITHSTSTTSILHSTSTPPSISTPPTLPNTPPTLPPILPLTLPTPKEIQQMYLADFQQEKYLLTEPQNKGIDLLINELQTSKAQTHISQNAKKAEAAIGITLPTFNDIPLTTPPPSTPSHATDIPTLFTKSTSVPPPITTLNQILEVFKGYFSTAQYDTSLYNSVKYFQAFIEREYLAILQLPKDAFHRIDSETKEGSGREVLINLTNKIVAQDTYQVFSTPVEIAKLKPYKYSEIIRRPLDLHTLKTKIEQNEYLMVECYLLDIIQVFTNCMVYNQKDSTIYKEAERLKAYAMPEILQTLPQFTATITFAESLKLLMSEILKTNYDIFQEQVSSLHYPQYYIVVKHPMTLSLISDRISQEYYKNITHFEVDIQKIHTASMLYNGPLSDITRLSKLLVQETQNLTQKYFPWYRSIFNKRTQTFKQKPSKHTAQAAPKT